MAKTLEPGRLEQLSAACRQRAESYYSGQRLAGLLIDTYNQLLADRSANRRFPERSHT
jgi:hypothetical protein